MSPVMTVILCLPPVAHHTSHEAKVSPKFKSSVQNILFFTTSFTHLISNSVNFPQADLGNLRLVVGRNQDQQAVSSSKANLGHLRIVVSGAETSEFEGESVPATESREQGVGIGVAFGTALLRVQRTSPNSLQLDHQLHGVPSQAKCKACPIMLAIEQGGRGGAGTYQGSGRGDRKRGSTPSSSPQSSGIPPEAQTSACSSSQ